VTVTHKIFNKIISEVSKYIIGRERELELLFTTLLSKTHMLIEGPPGTAKTLMAKLFAQSLGLSFKRIQMTPDMVPADIVGAKIIDPKTGELRTILGPIFANIILADEINRASPRTQSALLEAMQERQVTIEGETHKLPKPFTVIATQNPWETSGTFPLPDTQLDRFGIAIVVNYPSAKDEEKVVLKDHELKSEEPSARKVVSGSILLEAVNEASQIHVEDKIVKYIVSIVRATRNLREVTLGASPRASIMLLRYAKALAAIRNREYVIPDDVKYVAPYVLWHRIILNPSIYSGLTPIESFEEKARLIREKILKKIPAPW